MPPQDSMEELIAAYLKAPDDEFMLWFRHDALSTISNFQAVLDIIKLSLEDEQLDKATIQQVIELASETTRQLINTLDAVVESDRIRREKRK
jgi:hypothetical protein